MCIVYMCAYVNPPQWDPPQWPLSVALVKRNEKREAPLAGSFSLEYTYVRESTSFHRAFLYAPFCISSSSAIFHICRYFVIVMLVQNMLKSLSLLSLIHFYVPISYLISYAFALLIRDIDLTLLSLFFFFIKRI